MLYAVGWALGLDALTPILGLCGGSRFYGRLLRLGVRMGVSELGLSLLFSNIDLWFLGGSDVEPSLPSLMLLRDQPLTCSGDGSTVCSHSMSSSSIFGATRT